MKFLNSNYGNNGLNYADFAVKRTKTKGTRTPEMRANPFTGATTPTGNSTGTKSYGAVGERAIGANTLSNRIKSGRAGMGALPADQKTAIVKKKATKTGVALKKAGRFAMKNKVGLGLAAAGALGAVGYGAYRKLKSKK